MADSLQKIDRLIEGQGQLVEFAVDMKADLSDVKTDLSDVKADLSDVKTDVSDMKTDLLGVKADVSGVKADVSDMKTDLSETKATVSKIGAMGEITANGLAKLTLTVDDLRNEMRERFEQNEQTQQEILLLLRERLK